MYQFHVALVPRVPPEIFNVETEPRQTGLKPDAELAGTEIVFTTTVVLTHEVVLHTPAAFTKYMVETLGERTGEFPDVS